VARMTSPMWSSLTTVTDLMFSGISFTKSKFGSGKESFLHLIVIFVKGE
jgi:hypothetical protein